MHCKDSVFWRDNQTFERLISAFQRYLTVVKMCQKGRRRLGLVSSRGGPGRKKSIVTPAASIPTRPRFPAQTRRFAVNMMNDE